jgi:hypothetical protein
VHCAENTILGSGDKVVATLLSQGRQRLLERYGARAIGLDMEAYGTLQVCANRGIPALIVKGVQDDASEAKDESGAKDLWRAYAAHAAAIFAREVVRRHSFVTRRLEPSLDPDIARVAAEFRDLDSEQAFAYSLSISETYGELRRGVFARRKQPLSVLKPTDASPCVSLHAGGGAGKSRIIRRLFAEAAASKEWPRPMLIDLKLVRRTGLSELGGRQVLSRVASTATAPRRTLAEVEEIVRAGVPLLLIVDSVNEVSKEARTVLSDWYEELRLLGRVYLLAADRTGSATSFPATSFATVDLLDPLAVRTAIDSHLGSGAYDSIASDEVRELYRQPFFLALTLRSGYELKTAVQSDNFRAFLVERVLLGERQLHDVARGVFDSHDSEGDLVAERLLDRLDEAVRERLTQAGVLMSDGSFSHHLWRDYLVSLALVIDSTKWDPQSLDIASIGSSHLEWLSLAMEQIPAEQQRERFVKAVYNWNYAAASESIAVTSATHGAPAISRALRLALLAAIAEKLFDRVAHTRDRARRLLETHTGGDADAIKRFDSEDKLREYVRAISERASWFSTWQRHYCRRSGFTPITEDVEDVASEDSVIGWAASNAIRRSVITPGIAEELARVYDDARDKDDVPIRWRAVHALSSFVDAGNVRFLQRVLKNDGHHWVQYGTVRALVEVASKADSDLRRDIIEGLVRFAYGYRPTKAWMMRHMFNELVGAALLDGAHAEWVDAISPLFDAVLSRAEAREREALTVKIQNFRTTVRGEA